MNFSEVWPARIIIAREPAVNRRLKCAQLVGKILLPELVDFQPLPQFLTAVHDANHLNTIAVFV